MKKIRVVCAVIVKNGKIFSAERGYGNYKGSWEFPGGKIEPGEKPKDALLREIREEMLCDVKIHSYIGTVVHRYPEFEVHMRAYFCTLKNDFKILEHTDYRWLGEGELFSVNWLPSDIDILNKIQSIGYEKWPKEKKQNENNG